MMDEFMPIDESLLDLRLEEPTIFEPVVRQSEEKPAGPIVSSKRSTKTKTLKAKVNYSKPSRNKTSISYTKNGRTYAVFIDGIFENEVEISYTGKEFSTKNIVSVK